MEEIKEVKMEIKNKGRKLDTSSKSYTDLKASSGTLHDSEVRAPKAAPTYEELNNYCIQLSGQNQQLRLALQQANMIDYYKRLEYLFKVLENYTAFVDNEEFVHNCTQEVVDLMTPKEIKDNDGSK